MTMTPKEYAEVRHSELKEASLPALKEYAKKLGVILPPPGRVRALITAIIKKKIKLVKEKKNDQPVRSGKTVHKGGYIGTPR